MNSTSQSHISTSEEKKSRENFSQPAYYAVIPANVRYCKGLEPSAKLLYGEISALCNKEGYCWASNKYFSELYDVDTRTIQRWIESLKSFGFIYVDIQKNTFNATRKVYLSEAKPQIQKSLTERQKCRGGGDINVVGGGDKNVTHNNTCLNTTIEGNAEAAPPASAFSLLKKDQQKAFKKLKSYNLETSDDTLIVLAKTHKAKQIDDALHHLQREIDKGTKFRNSKIAFLRYILSGKVSMITEQASTNKKWAENAKKGMPWYSLVIHEKYAECAHCMKEISFNMPQDEFGKAMDQLWQLSKKYQDQ